MRCRNCLLILFAIAPFTKSLSQIDHVRVLIGQSDSTVINYLDSLTQLKTNPNPKVEKGASSDGDVILHCDFALNNQSFYNCRYVSFFVHKFPDGFEMCYKQTVSGSIEYAPSQLNYIKGNYNVISDNKWEGAYSRDYKIVATFERANSDNPAYNLTYELKSKN